VLERELPLRLTALEYFLTHKSLSVRRFKNKIKSIGPYSHGAEHRADSNEKPRSHTKK
jgi:hypothetical protein